ncbi:MAG: TonB-dependent receptor, partial [Pseudomonadota bacterium]
MRFPIRAAAVPLVALTAVVAQAQTTPTDIGEVIVSGGRTPVDAQSYARANTVITADDLEQRQIQRVEDALRQVPGVHVSRAAGSTEIRIRGAESNHVLVLIDGVETANSSEAFDFINLTADNIERIEVLRGPQSALYGAGATAGVINIITKRGIRNGVAGSVKVEGGTAPYKGGSALVQAGTERGDIALSISYQDDEGFDVADDGGEEDGTETLTFSAKGTVDLSDGFRLRATAQITDREAEFDSTAFGCGDSECYVFDGDSSVEGTNMVFGLSADLETFGGALVHTPSVSYASEENEFATGFGPSDDEASTFKAGYQAAYSFGAAQEHTVVGAIEFKRETFESSFAGSDSKERDALGYVFEYRGDLTEALFVQAGARYDQNDDFEDAVAWSASASYTLFDTGTRFHASIGQAQTNPSFFEQFGFVPGTFTPNPDLEPEQNFGFDIGVEQRFWGGRAVVDVTYFNETLTDEITGFGDTVINDEGDSDRQGIEVSLQVEPIDNLTVGASYTYLDATDPDGSQEVRRPRHQAGATIAYRFFEDRATIGADATFFGENTQRDFGDASFTSPKVR